MASILMRILCACSIDCVVARFGAAAEWEKYRGPELELHCKAADLCSISKSRACGPFGAMVLKFVQRWLKRWYSKPAGFFSTASHEAASLRSWAKVVLQHETCWSSPSRIEIMLIALLFSLEYMLLAAEEEREPDLAPLIDTVEKLTTYYTHLARISDASRLGGWHLAVAEARAMEAAARYLRVLKRLSGQETGDNCGCSHQGWDYYIGMHSECTKIFGLLDLPMRLSGNTSFERYLVLAQNCEAETWGTWQLEASGILKRAAVGTLCVQGDVSMLLLCANQALVRNQLQMATSKMEYAAVLALLMFDCLPSHHWAFSASDIFFNLGRLKAFHGQSQRGPHVDLEALSWRSRPQLGVSPMAHEVAQLRGLDLVQGRLVRSKCITELDLVCFSKGRLHIFGDLPHIAEVGLSTDGWRDIHLPICNDYGIEWVRAWQRPDVSSFIESTDRSVMLLPVATMYNPEHALHWLLPALVRIHGLDVDSSDRLTNITASIELLVYFDTRGTILDEEPTQAWMAEFFHLLSDHTPLFWHGTNTTRCWNKMLWGAGDFNIRFSHFNQLNSEVFTHLDRLTRQHPILAALDTSTRVALRWRCSSCTSLESELWKLQEARGVLQCGNCQCCKHRLIGTPEASMRLNVLVFQRSPTIGRHILNLDEVLDSVRKWDAYLDVVVLQPEASGSGMANHSGLFSPVSQMLMMARFDMLIGSYGGALTFGAFMHEGTIFELFPSLPRSSMMLCNPDWNANTHTVYGGLARQSGQSHVCLASDVHADTTESHSWRDLNITVNIPVFEDYLSHAVRDLFLRRYAYNISSEGIQNRCM